MWQPHPWRCIPLAHLLKPALSVVEGDPQEETPECATNAQKTSCD